MTAEVDSRRRRVMSLAGHLAELRRRLAIVAIAILLGAIAGFLLAPTLIDALRGPIAEIAQQRESALIYSTVTGAFDLRIQMSITIAIVIASPVWLYQILAFLVPGLKSRERRFSLGFLAAAVPLFLAGAVCGWLLFPHMVTLLTSFTPPEDATYLEAKTYYEFVLKLVIAVGVAFVMPVFLVVLNFAGVLAGTTILRGWRVAILAITVFTALATPAADLVSMFLLAIPMTMLYFAAVLVAVLHDRRRARILAAEVAREAA